MLVAVSWHNAAHRESLLTGKSLLGTSWLHSPAAPCRPSPETALSVGYYLYLGDLVQMHTMRHESKHSQASVKLSSGFCQHKNMKVSFQCWRLTSCPRTGTKENDGFEVGILIRVWGQLQHAVTELLHPPNVLHY